MVLFVVLLTLNFNNCQTSLLCLPVQDVDILLRVLHQLLALLVGSRVGRLVQLGLAVVDCLELAHSTAWKHLQCVGGVATLAKWLLVDRYKYKTTILIICFGLVTLYSLLHGQKGHNEITK